MAVEIVRQKGTNQFGSNRFRQSLKGANRALERPFAWSQQARKKFDQKWFGRIHLVGYRDSATYLQWELAACIPLAIVSMAISKRAAKRKVIAA